MFIYLSFFGVAILVLTVGTWAQSKFNNAMNTYSQVKTKRGERAAVVARELLNKTEARKVKIYRTEKHMTDHYNPQKREIVLSGNIHSGDTIADVGIAAHEVGHAVQHAEKSVFMMIWSVVGFAARISSQILWPIVIIGLVFGFGGLYGSLGDIFMYAGFVFFGISFLYSLANLPLEIDASKRALVMLQATGEYDEIELAGVKKVLDAAAFTYLTAMIASLLYLLRFAMIILSSRRR